MIIDTRTPEGLKMTEIGFLPEEWRVTRLGNLAKKMKAGGTPSRKVQAYWNGDIPFVLIEDLTSCGLFLSTTKETITREGLRNSSAWIVPPNSLLLSMYASIGKTAINTIPLATNQAILAIVPEADFDIKFGAYAIRYHATRLIIRNIQSTQKNVNKGIVKDFEIPLPPIFEQKQIAFVLSTVQRAIEKTESIINATNELKKSLMKHLFTYGPVSTDEAEEVVLRETEIGPIPEEWDIVKLGEIAECLDHQRIPLSSKERSERKGRIPYYGASGIIDYVDDCLFDEPLLLISEDGANLESRKSPIAYLTDGKCWVNNHIHVLRIKGAQQYFLQLYVNSNSIRDYLTGTTRPKLNKSMLMQIKFPLPALSIQQEIVNKLSPVIRKIKIEQTRKEALEKLFRTLLNNLMTGKIRVTRLEVLHDQTR